MSRYQAILFDFDGTLVDSWPAVYEAYLMTFQKFRPAVDSSHIQELRNDHFDYEATFKKVFGLSDLDPQIDVELRKNYLDLLSRRAGLIKGVKEVLAFLGQQKWAWGIVTSKKRLFVERVIERVSLNQGYACLICGEDTIEQKPHPQSLYLACSILKMHPRDVLYVGDSEVDITAATACEMDSIAVSYGYGGAGSPIEAWGAKRVLSDIRQLISFLTQF